MNCQHSGAGERSRSVKSTTWKLLRRKGKRRAAEEVEDHSLNFSGDTRGKRGESLGGNATGLLISAAQMSS